MDTIIPNRLRSSILLWGLLAFPASQVQATTNPRPLTARCVLDSYAVGGEEIANRSPTTAEFRNRFPGAASRHGFDIAIDIAQGTTLLDPFLQRTRDSLYPIELAGFDIGISYLLDRNRNQQLASWGAAVAKVDPIVAEARIADPDLRYSLGFDIAAGIFGDPALGAMGNFTRGPAGSGPSSLDRQATIIRNGLGPITRKGFDGATNFYWSRTKVSPDGRVASVPATLTPTPGFDEMADKGETIANADPLSAELRNRLRGTTSRRGFDIGMAAAEGNTLPGPGKQRIHDSLNSVEQIGFDIAVSFSLDRNRNAELASRGARVANADPIVAEARAANPDVRYWLGFDIATGIFGDPALGALGHFTGGPAANFPVGSGGSSMDQLGTKIRTGLDLIARNGFDGSVNLYWSGTKLGPDGRPVSVKVALPIAASFDELAAKGQVLANADPLSAELRNLALDESRRRGFDIGMAAAEGQTQDGPGKRAIYDQLCGYEPYGFSDAVSFSLQRNRNAKLATTGAAIANQDPIVAEARTTDPDPFYWLGFDIATGIFGDPALGALGNTATGPGSMGIRDALRPNAQRGFNASMTLHLRRKYR